jgi:hypothetical protein
MTLLKEKDRDREGKRKKERIHSASAYFFFLPQQIGNGWYWCVRSSLLSLLIQMLISSRYTLTNPSRNSI